MKRMKKLKMINPLQKNNYPYRHIHQCTSKISLNI